MKKVEDMKEIDFMVERLTEDAGESIFPSTVQPEKQE